MSRDEYYRQMDNPAYLRAVQADMDRKRRRHETPQQRREREALEARWAAERAQREADEREAQQLQQQREEAERQRLAALVAADAKRLRDAEEAARQREEALFVADVKARYMATGASEQDWQRDQEACIRAARIEIASGMRAAPLTAVEREMEAIKDDPMYRNRGSAEVRGARALYPQRVGRG